MELLPLPTDAAAVELFVEDCWLPYHRELERVVDAHSLDESVDLVAKEVAFRREWLREPDRGLWIAVEGTPEDPDAIAEESADLAGFVAIERQTASPVFDRPDRVVVDDLYVRERHRGTGLARELVDLGVAEADAHDCDEVTLEVDVDNDRAIAFYEKLGFEPYRQTMVLSV
ncbi:GCN5-like N-acetyltransferase [Salinarchaeum sp. Harcht-Bsk1]|uniref:GNAT family N-acetyltransferase n=1 Tax=Salinarchaeum sp. Harcht-Bsk1 TaxID=1333523 RepID=UPI0003422E2F|nr:GNAT family N-acetyltransferase [Salinarchaeum sp. Harcht-Bsk1]AGN02512.1 GCN5-like N-acetyltransferase [Salinarchaeum sp. Harcht-Bsk1]